MQSMESSGTEARGRLKSASLRSIAMLIIAVAASLPIAIVDSTPASANQPVGGPYAPRDIGTQIEGWVDMNGNCPALACHTYLKIERQRAWGWQHLGGRWISNNWGWRNIRVTQPYGCFNYRTVVDVYMDVPSSWGWGAGGVSLSGTDLKRYHFVYRSAGTRACR